MARRHRGLRSGHRAKATRRSRASLPLRANRHCEERQRRLVRRSSTSEGGSNPFLRRRRSGLLRGACHRPRIRATRWLAMTILDTRARQIDPTGKSVAATRTCPAPLSKNISLSPSGKVEFVPTLRASSVFPQARVPGVSPIVTNAALGCGGRGSVGAQVCSQGRSAVSEQARSAADERRKVAYGKTMWSWHPFGLDAQLFGFRKHDRPAPTGP